MTRVLGLALVALTAATTVSACSDDADFCSLATDQQVADTLTEFNPDDIPGTLITLRDARDQEATLRDAAPDAIRADIDLLVSYLDDLIDGLEDVDPNSEDRPQIFDELRPRNESINAASARIETYVIANCTE